MTEHTKLTEIRERLLMIRATCNAGALKSIDALLDDLTAAIEREQAQARDEKICEHGVKWRDFCPDCPAKVEHFPKADDKVDGI